jgi:hypothetical protein
MSTTTEKVRWSTIDDGVFRSTLGTIKQLARGWYFYPPKTRKADGGVFKSKAAAMRYAAEG